MHDYPSKIEKFAIYPHAGNQNVTSLLYCTLGLAGESGEFTEKVKKVWRDTGVDLNAVVTGERRDEMLKELGDVLWYVARAAHELGSSLDEVAELNVEKLQSRFDRGVLGGSGDNR